LSLIDDQQLNGRSKRPDN